MLRPSHKAIKRYLEDRQKLDVLGVSNEMGLRSAFQTLLSDTAREVKWHFVPEQRVHGTSIRPDGVFLTEWNYALGYWESKDPNDDLDREIDKRRAKNDNIFRNIIFENSRRATLFQNRVRTPIYEADLAHPEQVARLLSTFYEHRETEYDDWKRASAEFKRSVRENAEGLAKTIREAYSKDKAYHSAFEDFFDTCRSSINPNIRHEAVEEMLVQHLLTERLIRTVFDNPEFTKRNIIAVEVEKVIAALVAKSFDRQKFLAHLDRFYIAIENAARNLSDFREKQGFLDEVYEAFFQGYCIKTADTHGIKYTPQRIVDFMCASVAEVLEQEFGKKLGDKGVNILDPCTGTGNFIVNLIHRIPKRDLQHMYREQLFANEIMLLPYYVSSLNIEHAYLERMEEYEAFRGLCFVDTLDMDERAQGHLDFMTKENTKRIRRQRQTQIMVVIGNPPYNTKQLNENDVNRNRKYPSVDDRVRGTYAADSSATSVTALYDPYVRFIRWATDRLRGRDGVVCLITNNSFVHRKTFDGMRLNMARDFAKIYHLDLLGDLRASTAEGKHVPNVFNIKVGVGVTIAIQKQGAQQQQVLYARVPLLDTGDDVLTWLGKQHGISSIQWQIVGAQDHREWIDIDNVTTYSNYVSMGTKESKLRQAGSENTIFVKYSRGVATCRDAVVFGFDQDGLAKRLKKFVKDYNAEVLSITSDGLSDLRDYTGSGTIKWSESLKAHAARGIYGKYDSSCIRESLYRPYCRSFLYFDRLVVERVYVWPSIMPSSKAENENRVICLSGVGHDTFRCSITNKIVELKFASSDNGGTQCFPFYVYNEDGTGRRENITDWALAEFQKRYGASAGALAAAKDCHPEAIPMAEGSHVLTGKKRKHKILPADGQDDKSSASSFIPHPSSLTKWDIFYYVYGLLHHPGYREKYADNLKRELPRIPYAPDFWAFSEAGKRLAELHLKYEELPADLPENSAVGSAVGRLGKKNGKSGPTSRPTGAMTWLINEDVPLSYHVEKMKLTKPKDEGGRMKDEPASLRVNSSLTLANIPPQVFDYRLGNRSALEWVIDQYQISTDKRSGITSDPNREDDEQYIVRLIGQVIHVSLETVKIVNGLPKEFE